MKTTAFIICALLFFSSQQLLAQSIKPEEASKHVGESVTVCGKIFNGRYLDKSKGKPTLLNMGAAYPDQPITIVINDELRNKLSFKPEEKWKGKSICVTGKIELFKDKPQIIIEKQEQVKAQ